MSMSITPVSSITSSPRGSTSSDLPIIDSQSAYDQDWENDIDNDMNDTNDNNEPDNENNSDDMNNENTENTEPETVATEVIIVHPENKGISAWLAHLHRNQTRNSILQNLKSLVF